MLTCAPATVAEKAVSERGWAMNDLAWSHRARALHLENSTIMG